MSEDDYGGARPPRFSQSYGYTEYPIAIQHQSLDAGTRMDLWNVLEATVLEYNSPTVEPKKIWCLYLRRIGSEYTRSMYVRLLQEIVFDGEWYEVYDLLQEVAQRTQYYQLDQFARIINHVLALNRAGCRLVGNHVTEIAEQVEIDAVEQAMAAPLPNAAEHIKRAVALLASRNDPNFSKVIQEAMSAAESASQTLAGVQGVDLTKALKAILRQQPADPPLRHPALINGWTQLYGFTSDSSGIRHSLHDGTLPLGEHAQDFAQYFVVTCSAFVNLVTALKASGR